MNVIFAITKEQVPVYKRLSEFIEGSKVGELADDSSNVVELVEANYNVSRVLVLECYQTEYIKIVLYVCMLLLVGHLLYG